MKLNLLLLSLFLSIAVCGQVPTTNLASEYKFTNGTLTDAVGNSNLTQIGSNMTLVDNRANGASKAVDLNGDYLQSGPLTELEHLSISYWIKTTTNNGTIKTIIDNSLRTSDANTQAQYGWYTFLQNGKVGVAANFHYKYNNAGLHKGEVAYTNAIGTTNIADGAWHHVAITLQKRIYWWQGSNWVFENVLKVYIDGVLEATALPYLHTGVGSSVLSSSMFPGNSVTIGNINNGNSLNQYTEIIDDIRLYKNHLLTPSEVINLKNEVACSAGTGLTAIAKNITRQLDSTGNLVIAAEELDNGTNADCDADFSLSIDKSSFSCLDIGANTVTLTATGLTGSQSSAIATVTILPAAKTQDITVQLDASGNATITAADIDDGSAAICNTSLTQSLDITTFSCSDLGPNIVTLTVNDGNGNIGTKTATVTVADTIAPTAIGKNISVLVDALTGIASITPAMINNGSTDNCAGGLTMSLSKTIFRCEDTGDNTVIFKVKDASGNEDTTPVKVTVTSEAIDQTISASNTNICIDGTTSSIITMESSEVGFNYSLRNSATNAIVDGPTAGTGSAIDFTTGNLTKTSTFNVLSEKVLSTTQSALDFDGANDYVAFGADNRGVTTQITVAAWIKTSKLGTEQTIINKYDNANGYHLIINTSGYVLMAGRDGIGYRQSGSSSTRVNDGEWHYIAGSVNVTTGVWSVFVDGVLENSASHGAGTTLASNTGLVIGGFAHQLSLFTGQMDQLTIWDIALDEATISANMTSCLSGSETNVVGHFIFEDGSGTTLSDKSSLAYHGGLKNMDNSDWVQIISPSCGPKVCDYQMSSEITIGDTTAPIAIAKDINLQLDGSGSAILTTAAINNGSSDNCTLAGNLVLSLDKPSFSCDDIGAHTVVLTVTDESGNESTANATVTITSPVRDETVSSARSAVCSGGNSTSIATGGSTVGVNYFLRNSANNAVVDGPKAGTGSGISFNTGAINSSTTFNVMGNIVGAATHSALHFDGVNDKVVTSYTLPTTNTLTIELWLYPELGSFSRILSSYQGESSVLAGEILFDTYDAAFNNGKGLRFGVSGAGNVFHSLDVPNALTLNTWNHVAVTFDNGVIEIYSNGVLKGTSGTASFISIPASSANIVIGEDRLEGTSLEYFKGQIDEVRIWNTARTASQIAANKNNCFNGNEAGLELFYDFNENTGTTATDLAGSNNGTLTNMDAGTNWVSSGIIINCGTFCNFQMSTEVTVDINPSYNLTETVSVCKGDSFTFPDGAIQNNITSQVIHTSYLKTLNSGCDSIITTTINVISIDNSISLNYPSLTAAESGANYQWIDCSNQNAAIAGETHQTFTPITSGDYAVEISMNGCTVTTACLNVTGTGINNLDYSKLKIYPNPASDVLHILCDDQIDQVFIYSVNGVLVQHITSNCSKIDISELKKGLYFINVKAKKDDFDLKFIKE